MGKTNSKTFLSKKVNELEQSVPTPSQSSPAWRLMVKKGVHINLWNSVWHRYTRKGGELQWPLEGTFELSKIQYLQKCMLEQNARHAMWEAFHVWEQHARMLANKEIREQEKERTKSIVEKANEFNKRCTEEIMEKNDRQYCMVTDRMYVTKEKKIEEKDQVLEYVLDKPPPYATQVAVQANVLQPAPLQPVPQNQNLPQFVPPVVQQPPVIATPVAPVINAPSAPLLPTFSAPNLVSLNPANTGASPNPNITGLYGPPPLSSSGFSTPRTPAAQRLPLGCNSPFTRSQFFEEDKDELRELAHEWMEDVNVSMSHAFRIFNGYSILVKNFVLACVADRLMQYWEEISHLSRGQETCPQDIRTMSRQAEGGLLTDVSSALLLESCWKLRDEAHYKLKMMSRAQQEERAHSRAFPMREVPPVITPGVGGQPAQTVTQFVHTPWTRAELVTIKKELPDPRKNPTAFYEGLESATNLSVMTLKDIEMLFGFLVPTEVWRQVRDNDDQATGIVWARVLADDLLRVPGELPLQSVRDLPARLILRLQQLIPRANVNWDRLAACKQKDGEEVTDFFSKMEEMFKAHSGQDLGTIAGRRIFANQFVTNLNKEIGDMIRQSESSWPAKEPAELLTMAVYYENIRNTEKNKKDQKIKDLKTKMLFQQAFPNRGRMLMRGVFQRGGGRGRGVGRSSSVPVQQERQDIGYNTCAYCHEEGHWKQDCPALQALYNNRGRGRSFSRGRGVVGRGQDDINRQGEQPNYFDAPIRERNYSAQDCEQDFMDANTFEYPQ